MVKSTAPQGNCNGCRPGRYRLQDWAEQTKQGVRLKAFRIFKTRPRIYLIIMGDGIVRGKFLTDNKPFPFLISVFFFCLDPPPPPPFLYRMQSTSGRSLSLTGIKWDSHTGCCRSPSRGLWIERETLEASGDHVG